ncbi:hypothetical protein UB31_33280 [Bradyrhizobium sp. LTSP849]|jgi:hypothetical protein|uniref:hypothetical protein n=1 Tax=Bradyrhizobium sp. LTSP849 TaxID=1615890 RepID=UPI0005D19C36|nr:hypothetical protein [Bradyrhizobium sp. LTSP849]KJC38583.1 hypothetical protein UB31_33280 [Bradyrhizobium sp. LTSP849]
MQPIDFRYRLSDQGRIVLGSLSSEETLEFEVLSRRDREGLIDLPSELRLLELYVKYGKSGAEVPLAPLEPADDPLEPAYEPWEPVYEESEPLQSQKLPLRSSRQHAYVVPMVIVMSVSFMLIAMLIS